jgi:hypothetical protein
MLLLARKLDLVLNMLTSAAGLLFVEFYRTHIWESLLWTVGPKNSYLVCTVSVFLLSV